MYTLGALYNIIKVGFLERSRRYSFFITLGLIIFVSYKYIPPSNAKYLTLSLGNIRGVYNSAWIGAALAMISSTLLSIPAFYLVKNSVERDIRSGVGQIIAASPVTKMMYIMGKMLSNFTLLSAMVCVIAFSAFIMQLVRGEDIAINLIALLSPFIYSTLPTLMFISALAILFETIPFLRGTFGNIVFFFLWIGYNTLEVVNNTKVILETSNDLFGISPIISSMTSSASAAFADYQAQFVIGMTPVYNGIKTFEWQGVQWTVDMVAGRFLWIIAAIVLTSAASFFFDRFDTGRNLKNKVINKKEQIAAGKRIAQTITQPITQPNDMKVTTQTFFERLNIKSGFLKILFGELLLMFKGLCFWYYLVLIGLNFFAIVLPIETVQQVILPLIWIWPLTSWSSMGVREKRHRVQLLVFSSPNFMKYQFTALLLSGSITAVLAVGGVAIRFLIQGMWLNIAALIVASLFISSLALLCGVWSGNSKLFEMLYMVVWYIGPLNKVKYLDFIGASQEYFGIKMYVYCFIAAIIFTLLAIVGRIKQTKHTN